MEYFFLYSFYHVFAEHEVLYVLCGNDNSPIRDSASRRTYIEESLNFFVYAADRLYFPELICRSRYRSNVLFKRDTGERRERNKKFCCSRAVTINLTVGLFKRNANTVFDRLFFCVARLYVGRYDLKRFCERWARKRCVAVRTCYSLLFTCKNLGRDARRNPKTNLASIENGKAA